MIGKVLITIPPLVNYDEMNSSFKGPDFEAYRLVSPIEPCSVAANLRERNFMVKLFDMGIYYNNKFDKLTDILREFQPDAVVLVQSILTFATAQDWDGAQAFQIVKRYSPNTVTILTGSHATNYPGKAVREKICDYSIKGEVDFAVGDLLVSLNEKRDLSSLTGLAYYTDLGDLRISEDYPEVDVKKLPLPAYNLLSSEEKEQYSKILEFGKIRFPEKSTKYRDIMTSRSCISCCAFCSVAHLRGEKQKYRRKQLDQVMTEIESALEDGIEEIHFFDDLFAGNEKQIYEFTNELVRRNLKFHWFVAQGMPLWPLSRDVLKAMKETGMYRVICSLESGNNRVLKEVMGKPLLNVEHNHQVLTWAKDLDLEIIGMFVIGMPGERRNELLDTVRFAEEHPEIDYSIFSIATPMVGTRLMNGLVKQGQLDDPNKINRVIKRTVALFSTDEIKPYELGIIRAFDWDRINFSTPERQGKYARMVGLTMQQLEEVREFSKRTFYQYFPKYDGPLSYLDLFKNPGLLPEYEPLIPERVY